MPADTAGWAITLDRFATDDGGTPSRVGIVGNLGERERRAAASGRRALPCPSCGRFKGRPSDVCGYCGDDPVTFNGSRVDFDRAVWGC